MGKLFRDEREAFYGGKGSFLGRLGKRIVRLWKPFREVLGSFFRADREAFRDEREAFYGG